MPPTRSATDLLVSGESALVIFTRDRESFTINNDETGESRAWVLDPDRRPDRVIIYYRDPNRRSHENDIYLADFVEVRQTAQERRYLVRYCRAKCVGTTPQNWRDFAETYSNSIRYIP